MNGGCGDGQAPFIRAGGRDSSAARAPLQGFRRDFLQLPA
jgi:hypothetical protein